MLDLTDRHAAGMTLEEIGSVLDLSHQAVQQTQARAIHRLRVLGIETMEAEPFHDQPELAEVLDRGGALDELMPSTWQACKPPPWVTRNHRIS